jgi:hypothetical protein
MSALFIASNKMVIIKTRNGGEVLLSNNKPVAGYSPEIGWYRTSAVLRGHAGKHIGRYLLGIESFSKVPQEYIHEQLK